MIKWEKISRTVSQEGTTIVYAAISRTVSYEGTTIVYAIACTPYTIESRKRHIRHANGMGTWDHTTYYVLKDGEEIAFKMSLGDAKEYAEAQIERGR